MFMNFVALILLPKGSLTYRFFPRETSYVRFGVGGGGLQLGRFSVNIMEKFDSFFESLIVTFLNHLCRIKKLLS